MKAYRVHLTSWTASFRYPNLISGFQPSLVVPPLSTLYGLISAATGRYICARDLPVGFVYTSGAQTIELETIYQFSTKGTRLVTKPNVIRRQILFDNHLWLYLSDAGIADAFAEPHFQLLLGRSNDLATVAAIDTVELEERSTLDGLRGTVVPMKTVPFAAPIQALPVSFTDEIPRRGIGIRPFYLLEYDFEQQVPIAEKGYFDAALNHQIYWHDYTETL